MADEKGTETQPRPVTEEAEEPEEAAPALMEMVEPTPSSRPGLLGRLLGRG